MKKVNIKNFHHSRIGNVESLYIFLDQFGSIVLLPTLFSIYTQRNLACWVEKKVSRDINHIESKLVLREISSTTANQYLSYLFEFLSYLEQESKVNKSFPNIHLHEHATNKLINHYINKNFILDRKRGIAGARAVIAALKSYYNWLSVIEVSSLKNIYLEPRNREQTHKNTKRKSAPKYLTKSLRSSLLKGSSNIRNEIILRMGWEVGLRSKENCGLFLFNFEYGGKERKGLNALFLEMKANKRQQKFSYFLPGKYVKQSRKGSGASRMIYFNRNLLERMYTYLQQERPKSPETTFFLKNSPSQRGAPIATTTATHVFRSIKKELIKENDPSIHSDHSYHHGRHTFGTEQFHSALNGQDAVNASSGSPAMIHVAELLGHNLTNIHNANRVTANYIRSVNTMILLEDLC